MRTTVFGRKSSDSTSVRAHDIHLVSEESSWAQGYATSTGYTQDALAEFGQNTVPDWQIGSGPRLHAWTRGLERVSVARCIVPAGCDAKATDATTGHRDLDIPTSPVRHPQQVARRLQQLFTERGWVRDQHGRCLHPFWEQLVDHPRIGLHTGLGGNRSWGEAILANAVVVDRRDQVLLIRHGTAPDSAARLELPSGYSTPDDEDVAPARWWAGRRPVTRAGILRTACRHAAAGIGQEVPVDATMAITRAARPVTWSLTTANAWTVVFTVLIRLPRGVALPPGLGTGASAHPLADLGDLAGQLEPGHRRPLLDAVARSDAGGPGITSCAAGQR